MLASVIITIKTNLIGRKLTDLSTEFYNYSAGLGFKIDDIVITGRDKTAKQDILNALQLSRETNILNLDLRYLQQKVEQLPWVRHAVVKRRFFPTSSRLISGNGRCKASGSLTTNSAPLTAKETSLKPITRRTIRFS